MPSLTYVILRRREAPSRRTRISLCSTCSHSVACGDNYRVRVRNSWRGSLDDREVAGNMAPGPDFAQGRHRRLARIGRLKAAPVERADIGIGIDRAARLAGQRDPPLAGRAVAE